jgi:hypothetical protein
MSMQLLGTSALGEADEDIDWDFVFADDVREADGEDVALRSRDVLLDCDVVKVRDFDCWKVPDDDMVVF